MDGVPGDSLRIMADSLRRFLLGLRVRPQAPVTECCDASLSGARKYSSANSRARLRALSSATSSASPFMCDTCREPPLSILAL